MKSFKQFVVEDSNPGDANDYHHTSQNEIDVKSHNEGKGLNPNHPIWLSHNKNQAEGWHQHIADGAGWHEPGSAYTYKVKIHGKIAHHKDPKVKDLFKEHGIDASDYSEDLVSNPDHEEVHDHPATKILKQAGYHGYTYPDYDSHDFEKDHDATVIFNRKHAKMELLWKTEV